jgi:hypothetical protein
MRCLRSPALKYFPSIVVSPALRPFNAVTTERGVLHDLFQALSQEGNFEWLCVDATVIRAPISTPAARAGKRGA